MRATPALGSVLALALAIALPSSASAHGVRPGVLALDEVAPARFAITWIEPEDSRRPTASAVAIRFPEGCTRAASILTCSGALEGTLAFDGLPDARTRVVVSIARLDGTSREDVVTGDASSLDLSAPPGSSLVAWIAIGLEHVLGGLDHLAFVLGLLLVCGFHRRLVLTITAFTLAHSLTLALAALDVLALPSAAVEATIAASVLLVAREGMRSPAITDTKTLTQRMPWLVAALFGLVHGLGFAGALSEIGLPRGSEAIALAGFNVGVELGQLAVIGVALVVTRALARSPLSAPAHAERARAAIALAIGGLGALWLIERTVAIVTASGS